MRILAVHGFLGRGKDWDYFKKSLSGVANFETVELEKDFKALDPRSLDAFSSWVGLLKKRIEAPVLLLGYSLGARLASHLLVAHPELFLGAILISGHPGLESEAVSERSAREAADEKWASRFEDMKGESWEQLLLDWNQQPVLRGLEGAPVRLESDHDRQTLAMQLRRWSLSKQRNLSSELAEIRLPLLWIAGENDLKFAAIAAKMRGVLGRRAFAEVWIAPVAGHRVPWDQSEACSVRIQNWIGSQIFS